MLPGDGLVDVDVRTVLHFLAGQRDVKAMRGPVCLAKGDRRNENSACVEESIGLDDEIANHPPIVVNEEIYDGPDVAVACADGVPLEVFQAS